MQKAEEETSFNYHKKKVLKRFTSILDNILIYFVKIKDNSLIPLLQLV